jgi:hypothetical protein
MSVDTNSKRLLQGNGLHTFRMAVELRHDSVLGLCPQIRIPIIDGL